MNNRTEFKNSDLAGNPIRRGLPMLIVAGSLIAAVMTLIVRAI